MLDNEMLQAVGSVITCSWMISWLMNQCFHEHSLFADTLTDSSPPSGLYLCRYSELNQHRRFSILQTGSCIIGFRGGDRFAIPEYAFKCISSGRYSDQ
jgi:hypothetical protein